MSKFDVDSFLKERREKERLKKNNIKANDSKRTLDADKFLHERTIGFDTFSDDLNTMNTTLSGIYGGWQDADTMAKTRDSVSSFYNRLSAYEDYRKNYGTEEDELPDLSELMGFYKTSLDDWDNMTTTYSQYKSADEFNKAVKDFGESEAQNKKMRGANLLEENSELAYMESNLRTAKAKKAEADSKENAYTDAMDSNDYTDTTRSRGRSGKSRKNNRDFISYMNSIGYSSIEELESAIADKKAFIGQATVLQNEQKALKSEDFEQYSNIGANVENPSYDEAEHDFAIFGHEFGGEEVKNKIKFAKEHLTGYASANAPDAPNSPVPVSYIWANEDEQKVYEYYLGLEMEGKVEKGTAQKYLDSIEGRLKDRHETQIITNLDDLASGGFWAKAGASALSVPYSFTGAIEHVKDSVEYGKTGTMDDNFYARASSTIRGRVSKDVDWNVDLGIIKGDAFDFLYNTTMSGVDSLAATAVYGSLGGVSLGLSAAASATNDALDRGFTDEQALKQGFISGAFEMLFESISIGKFLNEDASKGLLRNLASSMFVNASEETFTELANIAYDTFANGDLSNYQVRIQELVDSGKTPEEARRIVIKEFIHQAHTAGASGAVMGGGFTTINAGKYHAYTNSLGKAIRNNDNVGNVVDLAAVQFSPEEKSAYDAYTRYANKGINAENIKNGKLGNLAHSLGADAEAVLASKDSTPEERAKAERILQDLDAYIEGKSVSKYGREGVKALYGDERSIKAYIDKGLESAEGTELRQLAEKFKAKLDKGKKLTTSEITQLVDATRDKVKGDIATTTEARLTELGEEGNVSEIAKIIAKRELGEKLTSAETEMLENSKIERKAVELAEATAGMSKEYADLFIENYNGKDDIEDYADSFELVRYYAEKGVDTDHVLEHKGVLTEAQALDIYKKAPKIQRTEQQKAIDKLVAKHSGKLSYKSVVDDSVIDYDNKGTEGKVNWNSLNSRQRQAITFAKGFAKGLGINLKFVTDGAKRGFNGKFVREENTLYIDVYAGIDQLEDGTWGEESIIPTLAHEITHWAKDKSSVLYAELSDKIFSALKMATGKSEIELIAEKRAELDGKGIKRNDAYARDEIIARACEDMLSMSEEGKKMFNSMSESEQKSFVAKIKELINDIVNWIDELLGSYKSDSREAKLLRDYKEELQDIAKTWDAMLVSAMDANAAMNAEGIFKDLHNGISEDGTTIIGESNVQMSEKTYRNGGRAFLVNWLETQSGLSDEDKADIIMQTDRVAEIMRAVAEGNELPDYSRWANMEVVKTESGEALSVIVNNGDYKLNIDFSQVCKKRVALDTVLNSMVQSGALDTHILSETDVAELNNIIKKHDFEIACALCFVDAKRYRVDAWADSFCNGVDEEVKKGVYKHKYGFNEMVRSLVPKGSGINVDEFNFTGRDIKNQPTKNLLSNAKDSQLDFSLIDEIMAKNDSKSAQHRYAKAIKENPAIRKILNHSEIISSIGLDKIRVESPAIYALINGHQGTAKPKFAHGGVAYGNNVLQAVNFTPESARMVGGVRCQSFSDFMANMVVDYAQFVSELSAKQLTAHSYTKEPLFVKLFGLTGMKINMSLVPKAIDMTPEQQEKFAILKDKNANKRSKAYQAAKAEYAKLAENAGLDENGNYIWEDETFPYDIAMDIVVDPRYSANCGTIAVGISDNHIRKLLADERISMVIPYHKSSLNYEVAVMRDIALYNDYTNVQNTRDSRTGKKLDKDKGQVDFDFYGDLYGVDGKEGTHDPRQTAQNYLDWCAENNYIPKFDTFKGDPNYYKLLIDFRVYDTDGTYREQQAVKPIYPEDAEFKDLILNGVKDKDGKVYGGLIQSQENSDRLKAETKQIVNEYRGVLKEKYGKDVLVPGDGEQFSERNSSESNSMKEQIRSNQDKLNEMNVIANIITDKKFKNSREAFDWALGTLKQSGYKAERVGFGTVIFDDKRLKNALQYIKTQEDYIAFAFIPKVIKNGIVIGNHLNHKERGYGTITFSAPVEINGTRVDMAVVVRMEGKNYYKLHRVLMPDGRVYIDKKRSNAETAAATTSVVDTPTDITSVKSLSHLDAEINEEIVNNEGEQLSERRRPATDAEYLELAKNPDENKAKLQEIVDEAAIEAGANTLENGEPMHYYHGTRADFTSFDTEKARLGNFGYGFYFSPYKDKASNYGSLKDVYLFASNLATQKDHNITEQQVKQFLDKYGMTLGETVLRFPDLASTVEQWINGKDDVAIINALQGFYEVKGKNKDTTKLLSDMREIFGYDGIEYANETVLWNNKEVKLADPVTYDDDGNVIPLFERFSEKNDIRYSERRHAPTAHEVMGELKTLENRYKKLEADYGRLKEKLKIEKSLTKGKLIVPSQVEAVARYLLKFGDSNYSKDELAKMLNDLYVDLQDGATNDSMTWDEMYSKAYEVAKEIRSEAKVRIEIPAYYDMILKDIRSARIAPNEGQKGDAKHRFGDHYVGKFRGRVTIANDGTPLDIKWSEWASKYPSVFDKDIGDAQKLVELYDIYDDLRNAGEVVQEYEESEVLHSLATEIVNKAWLVTKYESTADKYDKRIKELNFEHRKAMDELKDTYKKKESDAKLLEQMYYGQKLLEKDKALADQKLADAMHYGKIVHKLREKREIEVAQAKAHGREKLAQYKENAERRVKIQSITKNCLTLGKKLLKNSPEEHIHKALRDPVINLLNAIDFSSKRMVEQNIPTNADVSLAKSLGKIKEMMAKASNGHAELVELYGHGLDEKIEAMMDNIDALDRTVADNEFILQKMSLEDLDTLDKIVKTIKTAVNKLNKFHVANHKEGIASLSRISVKDMQSLGKGKVYDGLKGRINKTLMWNNALPVYAFERFGEGGKIIFRAIQDGWDKFAFNVKKALDFAEGAYTSKEAQEWEKDVKTFNIRVPLSESEKADPDYQPEYQKVQITVPQIMSLYCLAKRDQAKGHILGGGIRVADFTIENKRKKEVITQEKGAVLSSEDIDKIVETLTPRQKAVADKLQEFMNTVCTEWGNEVSMARFGYKAFGEENYFPIKSDDNNISKEPNDAETSLFRLLNMSFTKSLTKNANNRVIISDIFDVFAQHASDMAKYNSLALPVLDAFQWYNYTEKQDVGDNGAFKTQGVKQEMESAFGKAAQNYFTTFLKDINGQKEVSRDTVGKGFFTNAKIAAVGANLRVVALQPTSYLRASAVIDNKYLAAAFAHKPKIDKAEKYCGIALWKSMGYYDTNIQRGVTEQIKHTETWKDKAAELSMKGAEAADKVTWGYLWNACELEIRDKRKDLKVGSEEFYNAIADRLREVIYKTQVVDSTLTRSQIMRSGDGYDKLLTSFASEPTLSYNMLMEAFNQASLDTRKMGRATSWKKNGKYVARTLAAYTVTNAVAALVESAFDAFRDTDDDDEKDLMYFMKLYFSNFSQDMSVIGKIPYIKEITSLIRGFSGSRTDTQWMESLVKTATEWGKIATTDKGNPAKAIKESIRTISYMSGLPFYNAYRDFMAGLDTFNILEVEDLEEMLKDVFE